MPENSNVGVASLVGSFGCESIVVSGAVRSTNQVNVSGSLSLPAASTCRTEKVWLPSPRPV